MPSQSVVKSPSPVPTLHVSPPHARLPHRFRAAPLFALLATLAAAPVLADAPAPLQASDEQSNTARIITRQLSVLHYNRIVLNDDLSSQIWKRYLDDMDNQHMYFLAADIQSFEPWRLKLDDQLKTGQMGPAFAMYNRLMQRQRERLEFAASELENNKALLDFTGKDAVENDRKNAPWARSKTELDQLWRLRLKAAALALKLSGKSSDEALATLKRRYKSQLTMLGQTSAEDAFQTFMNAFTDSYDPHTQYMSPRNTENFNINMSLQLEGIGAVLQTDDEYTKVMRVMPASPADKSRQIKAGDRIVAVAQGDGDFTEILGWRIDEVVDKIRGPKGSTVRLQILPSGSDGATKEVSLVRNIIELEDQAASKKVLEYKRNGKTYRVGVIKLPEFYSDFRGMQSGDPDYRSTTRDVHRLIGELKQERVQGIILDLRDNGGGSLPEVNDLVGEFIPTGPTVQVRDSRGNIERLGDGDPEVAWSGPLAVVINRLSASAAEIFAGAIQDYGRGLIVGSTSFGKGTVQSLRPLNHGQLKITEAKFYRISGASTQNKGVEPDIRFPELMDPKDIGESALDNAMPWDTIKPASYQRLGQWNDSKLKALDAASQTRQARNPDIRYLIEQQKLLAAIKDQKITSLNEKVRRADKQAQDDKRLAIENRRRAAKNQTPFKTWKEVEDMLEQQNPEHDPRYERPEEQALLQETGEILLDTLSAPGSGAAKTIPRNPAAALPPVRRPVAER